MRTLFPHDEPPLRRLLRLLSDLRDGAGANRAYQSFADRIATEFDAKPAPETQALIARVAVDSGAFPSALAADSMARGAGRRYGWRSRRWSGRVDRDYGVRAVSAVAGAPTTTITSLPSVK